MENENIKEVKRCKTGCGFFASFDDYCSKCYRDSKLNVNSNKTIQNKCNTCSIKTTENTTTTIKPQDNIESNISNNKKDHSRCFQCNRKLRTNILFCKCSHAFCSEHLFYKDHNCTFNFKEYGKSIIQKQNPKLKSDSGLENM